MQTSSLGQTFASSGTWQTSGGIWGSNTIGSGLNGKSDASRSRGGMSKCCFKGIKLTESQVVKKSFTQLLALER